MFQNMPYAKRADLKVAPVLVDFVENRLLPSLPLDADAFWAGLAALLHDFTPRNQALLIRRKDLQSQIDAWR